ncbi:ABC transporter ATP-binding protein [Streptomyces tagetis]|uniref:ABC transporter ATP-binding protein n=1 Tax=Streptomyces tagetis TaxID=2820809 RepID=UPI0027DE11E5|nr:ABC transporter ATP-binding protein [Streptomyces sp. RG38]
MKGISFDIGEGELFGLLGPNGAGKSTTIKILATLLLPTSGRARVLGHDVATEPTAVRRRIGYVAGGDRGLYERLSARDNLRYFAELHGITGPRQRRRIAELLELVDLTDRSDDKVEGFSRGMRQRLHIARGMLNEPRVLFLDEPTIGLDPQAARDLRATAAALSAQGTTVLLTTHYMHEADELCARIGVIVEGRLVALDTPAALKKGVSDRTVITVEVRDLTDRHEAEVRALGEVLSLAVTRGPATQVLEVQCADTGDAMPGLLGVLGSAAVSRVDTREPSLEDAYVALVSRSRAARAEADR